MGETFAALTFLIICMCSLSTCTNSSQAGNSTETDWLVVQYNAEGHAVRCYKLSLTCNRNFCPPDLTGGTLHWHEGYLSAPNAAALRRSRPWIEVGAELGVDATKCAYGAYPVLAEAK